MPALPYAGDIDLGSAARAFAQGIRPSRFNLVLLAIGGFAFLVPEETGEALVALCQRNSPVATTGLLIGVLAWAWTSWYFARVFSRFVYPGSIEFQGEALAIERFVLAWGPRFLGVGPALVVTIALVKCAHRGNGVLPLALAVALEGLMFAVFVVRRQTLLESTARRYASRVHSETLQSLWEDLGTRLVPSKVSVSQLPAITKATLCLFAWLTAALVLVFASQPVVAARSIGAPTILLLALSSWSVAGSWLTFLASWVHLPLWTAIAAYAFAISPLNDNHVAAARPSADESSAKRPSIVDDFLAWRRATGAAPGTPFVLVATEGGGIRAAYWTAAMLAGVQDSDPSFASHVYAISAVSGGSVGAAIFDAVIDAGVANCRNAVGDILSYDSLAPPLARMLYPDLLQRFVPFVLPGTDRGAALEDSWTESARVVLHGPTLLEQALDGPVWNAKRLPRLFLNATWVETGKRVVFSSPSPIPGCEDTQDGVALGSFSLADAALASARFPYVSPAETVRLGTSGWPGGHLVDGGYFENSGAQTTIELLAVLRTTDDPLADPRDARVVLLRFEDDAPPKPLVWASEIRAPPAALLSTRSARESLAIAELRRDPGLSPGFFEELVLRRADAPLPLGWLLSAQARTSINSQVDQMLRDGQAGSRVMGWWRKR